MDDLGVPLFLETPIICFLYNVSVYMWFYVVSILKLEYCIIYTIVICG